MKTTIYFLIRGVGGYLHEQPNNVIVPNFSWEIDLAEKFFSYSAAEHYLTKLPIGVYQIEKFFDHV